MIQLAALIGLALVVVGALALSMAPDFLALAVVGLMIVAVILGFIFGMIPTAAFSAGFKRGRNSIDQIGEVQSGTPWLAAQQVEFFFHQRVLDQLFADYVAKTRQQAEEGILPCDIEDVINEDSLALRSWQTVMVQIPGTLTALGLLGTFIGLITGISNIGFSSVDAALGSIEVLLNGIETAFFTSITGVIFSITFNISYKLLWNAMLHNLGLFSEKFHMEILPSLQEQERIQHARELKLVLERLDRIPKAPDYSIANSPVGNWTDIDNEQRMMNEIREGLQHGEFIFYVQPRCDITTNKIVGGEALIRWKHNEDLIAPSQFLPIVEANGFITQIDRYTWERVCQTIRRRIDAGVHPLPLSVNISKMDIMTMDVASIFEGLIRKYRIPTRYIEVEIAQNAFAQIGAAVRDLSNSLHRAGFRVLIDGFNGDLLVMNELKYCAIDAVKLDLRFINGKSPETIRNVFEQANRLGCPVVAEGIENTEQMTALRRCGCTEGQGYYLHKPMTVEEFEKKVSKE